MPAPRAALRWHSPSSWRRSMRGSTARMLCLTAVSMLFIRLTEWACAPSTSTPACSADAGGAAAACWGAPEPGCLDCSCCTLGSGPNEWSRPAALSVATAVAAGCGAAAADASAPGVHAAATVPAAWAATLGPAALLSCCTVASPAANWRDCCGTPAPAALAVVASAAPAVAAAKGLAAADAATVRLVALGRSVPTMVVASPAPASCRGPAALVAARLMGDIACKSNRRGARCFSSRASATAALIQWQPSSVATTTPRHAPQASRARPTHLRRRRPRHAGPHRLGGLSKQAAPQVLIPPVVPTQEPRGPEAEVDVRCISRLRRGALPQLHLVPQRLGRRRLRLHLLWRRVALLQELLAQRDQLEAAHLAVLCGGRGVAGPVDGVCRASGPCWGPAGVSH